MSKDSRRSASDGPGRSARKRARTRAELLVAARKIFAEQGYHEAGIAEITALADVGVGTFYLHFRDKDDLFNTLLEEGFHTLREAIMADMKNSRGPLLPDLIRAVLHQASIQRDLFQIALTAHGQGARKRRAESDLADYLLNVLETPGEEAFTGYDMPIVSRLIAGMITQCICLWCESEAPGPEIMAQQILLLVQHGLPEHFFGEETTLNLNMSGSDQSITQAFP